MNILRKHQWGSEKNTIPLPILHDKPSVRKIALSRMAIVLTIFFWIAYIISTILRQFIEGHGSYQFTLEAFSYTFVVSVLTFSALMYLIERQGAFERFSKHVRVSRALLDTYFTKNQPSITVLIPSYAEEVQVIRKTILSAMLQEYPRIRVVVLLDDNPSPKDAVSKDRLDTTRKLIQELQLLLETPYKHTVLALEAFNKQYTGKNTVSLSGVTDLAKEYTWAAKWLYAVADKEIIEDHVDIFFADQVLRQLAKDLELVADALTLSVKEKTKLSKERVQQLYRRLVWIFGADLTIFERKQFASLSHEANKAMNLNAYIGLMGGIYRPEQTPNGALLLPVTKKQKGDLVIPDSDFLLTLDADSILLRDYCLRLVYFLGQPDNARVAVTQTPYSSFRGAYSRIERLSGATTDIQHLLHQGMSHYGATFWVGANAVIRKRALDDIAVSEWIGGFEVKRFIQDRTVIEDTESSIDLVHHGWKLVNYPERLSYSATPPDFGSLIIQRRRWANGGLLILPKLWSQIRERKSRNQLISRAEVLLRLNYMASISWATFGLIFLLAYPYDGRLLSPLVLLAALPYFIAMAYDLKYCGYKYSDVIRIYGFNLILLPVNLAGVVKSLEQALTGKKIPFARTPKVKNRTRVPLLYLITPLLIVAFSLFTLWRNILGGNIGNALFAGFNAVVALWAIIAYIGIIQLLVDIWAGLTSWFYVENKPRRSVPVAQTVPEIDWKVVLYHGERNGIVPHQSLHTFVNENNYAKKGSIR